MYVHPKYQRLSTNITIYVLEANVVVNIQTLILRLKKNIDS